MTELYIEGHRVDLSDKIDYSITKTYLDLSDPSKLCDDWSKTIKIPMTPANKHLFGHWEQVDRVTAKTDGETDNTGVYFSPYIKLHYQLFDLGQIIMEGDMRFSKSFYDDKSRNYEVILYGNWNDTLNKLKSTPIIDIFNSVYPQDLLPVTAIQNYRNYTNDSERWKEDLWDEYAGYIITLLGENYYKDFNSESFYNGLTEDSAVSSDMPIPILTSQELRLDKGDTLLSMRVFFRVLEEYFKGKLLLDPQFFNAHNPYFTDTFYPIEVPIDNVPAEEVLGNYLHIDSVVRPRQVMVPDSSFIGDVLAGAFTISDPGTGKGAYNPSGAVLKPELTILGDNVDVEAIVVGGNITCYRPDQARSSWPGEALNYEFLTNTNVAGTDDKRYTLQYKVKDTYYLSGNNIEFLEGSKVTVSLPNTVSSAAGDFDYPANIQKFSIGNGATWSLSAIEGDLRVKMRINGSYSTTPVWFNSASPLTLYIGGSSPGAGYSNINTNIDNWWEIPTRTHDDGVDVWQYSVGVSETVNVVNRTGSNLDMSGNNYYVRYSYFINNTTAQQGQHVKPYGVSSISSRPSVWMGDDVDDYVVFGTSNNTIADENTPDGIKLTMIVGEDQSAYNPSSPSAKTNYVDVHIINGSNILLGDAEWRKTHNFIVVNRLKTRLIHNSSYMDLEIEGVSEGSLNALELPKTSVLTAPTGYVRNRCQFALTYNGEMQLTGNNLQGSYKMSNIAWQSAASALNLNIPINKGINVVRTPYIISGLDVIDLLTKYMRHFNLKMYTYNGHNIITTPNRILANGVYNKGIQIDYSSIEYAPVDCESTFITLGGEEDDNYLNARFQKKYHKNYGEFKKNSLNEFALEENPVLETFTPTITSRLMVKQASYYSAEDEIRFTRTGKLDEYNTVSNMDESGDRLFSSKLMFHEGLKTLFDGTTSTSNIQPALSLSSPSMQDANSYGYYYPTFAYPGLCEHEKSLKITLMSEFSADEKTQVDGSVLSTNFVKSNVVFYKYSVDPNSVYSSHNVYGVQELCHRYVEDLYSYDTRRAKAKAIVDLQKFRWGNLVNIGGVSFLVTKISNWNNNHSLCDVEMVSVPNIENYKISDRILYDYDEVNTQRMGVSIGEDFIITVANSNGADIEIPDFTFSTPDLGGEYTAERIFDDYVIYKCRIVTNGPATNTNSNVFIKIGGTQIRVLAVLKDTEQ